MIDKAEVTNTPQIKGLTMELERLRRGPVKDKRWRRAMSILGGLGIGFISRYPAPDKANSPPEEGSGQWYERRWGVRWTSDPAKRWDPSRLKREVFYFKNMAGVQNSEQLGDRFRVVFTPDHMKIVNTASYAPDVHHYKSKEHIRIFRKRGWRSDKDMAKWLAKAGLIDKESRIALRAKFEDAKKARR